MSRVRSEETAATGGDGSSDGALQIVLEWTDSFLSSLSHEYAREFRSRIEFRTAHGTGLRVSNTLADAL